MLEYISHLEWDTDTGILIYNDLTSNPWSQSDQRPPEQRMATYPVVVVKENETKPAVIMRSEHNREDMKCVLLERALTIKEGKIQNLEKKIQSLQIELEQTERKLVLRQEKAREINKVIIVNKNNNVSSIYCLSATVVLLFGFMKIIKT